jgi:hypothetical protein
MLPAPVEPNGSGIVPIAIIVDQDFFACFDKANRFDGDAESTITGEISITVSFTMSAEVNTPLPIPSVGAMNN